MHIRDNINIIMDDEYLSSDYKQGFLFAVRQVELLKKKPSYSFIAYIDSLKDQLTQEVINNVGN